MKKKKKIFYVKSIDMFFFYLLVCYNMLFLHMIFYFNHWHCLMLFQKVVESGKVTFSDFEMHLKLTSFIPVKCHNWEHIVHVIQFHVVHYKKAIFKNKYFTLSEWNKLPLGLCEITKKIRKFCQK